MALRVGGGKPAAPPMEEQLPEELAEELPEELPEEMLAAEEMPEEPLPEEAGEEMASGGEVDPLIAGYKGPESGPFACGNCVFFGRHGEGTCGVVSGPIDEGGICNLFTSATGAEGMDEPMLEEEMVGEELPAEEPEAEMASEEGY